jgi:hypothetical protein
MNSSELYDQDFALWLNTTATQLKVRPSVPCPQECPFDAAPELLLQEK